MGKLPHWQVSENVISVDFQKVKTDEELRQQALAIIHIALIGGPEVIGMEFGPDTAPCEYVAPDKDPA